MARHTDLLTVKIGLRLRKERRAQGLSLSMLTARTGFLSRSRIGNYEQGIRRLGLEEAQKLAAALGTVSSAYLLCLEDEKSLSQNEINLLQLFRDAGSRGKDEILNIAWSVARVDEGGQPARGGPFAPSAGDDQGFAIPRRRGHSTARETELLVQARFPHFSLEYATFENRGLAAAWRCARHGVTFSASSSSLLAPGAVGCPACCAANQRERWRRRFTDPDLDRHLGVLKDLGDERNVAIHRLRAAGSMATEISSHLGMNQNTVLNRLQKIRRVLAEADEKRLPDGAKS